MKPMDIGYQQARGIGNVKFDTEQNMSLEPETQAIRKSALPNAIGYIGQQTPYITEMLKSSTNTPANTVTNTANAITNTANTMANFSTGIQSFTPTILSPGASVQMTNGLTGGFSYHLGRDAINALTSSASAGAGAGAALGSVGSNMTSTVGRNLAQNLFEHGAGKIGEQAAKEGAKRVGSSALGTALGAVGTAIGGYTMANQIAGFGDHRNASDMLANVGRQHITTDMGNSYTNYNGVNADQEVALENANTRAKQLGFGMNAIGTGASLGGLLASTGALGSIGGPLGTAIGAGVGLLVGGLGSLFGWGDNEDEVRRQISLANDNIAMYNRQQEAVAKSKDVAAEFSDRQGISAAATGKEAGGNMENGSNIDPNKIQPVFGIDGWSFGFPSSVGMSGELLTIGRGKNRKYTIIPSTGNKKDDNKDSIPLKDVKPGSPHTIVRKDLAKQTKDVLDGNYQEGFKDWYVDQVEELQSEERYNKEMKKYKNGKLPGFESGKRSYMMPGISDYLINLVPHLYEFGIAKYMQDRYKNASTYVPNTYVQNNGSANAINKMLSIKWDPTHALNDARKAYNQTNWEANRMAGLGAGAQAVLRNTNFLGYLDKIGDIRSKEQEINNNYTLAGLNKAIEHYDKQQQLLTDEAVRRFGWQQQQNAVKEYGIDLKGKDKASAFGGAGHDLYGVMQMARSMGIDNQMLDLYNQWVENDKVKAQAALDNANANRSRYDKQYNSSVADLIKTYNTINSLYNPTINPLNVLRMIG